MLLTSLTICFLSVVSQAQGQFVGRGPCPAAPPLANVDLHRMGGLWYAGKRIDNYPERNHVCSQIVLTANSNDTFTVEISGIIQPNGVDFSWKALVVPVQQPTFGAYQVVNSKYAAQEGMNMILLDTDYDNYAVFTSCATMNGAYHQYGWILSRSTVLTHMDQGLRVLQSNNIPAEETINVSHRNCPN